MFGEFISAIAGDSASEGDEDVEVEERSGGEDETATSTKPFDFWGAASGLAERVKQGTAELAHTVRDTDWRAEIQAFGEDLAEETEELGASAVAAAQHAVDNIEHLPQTAQGALPAMEQRRQVVRAQLGQVGSSLGRFGREFVANTSEMFEQASSAIQSEMSAAEGRSKRGEPARPLAPASWERYSRLDSDIAAMQRDSATYCDEPEDSDDYAAWLQESDPEKREGAVAGVVRDNTFMAELESRIVPAIVERDTFWRRYFYRLHLLQEAHRARTQLAARAAAPQEEEAPWDDDETPTSPAAASPAAPPAAATLGGVTGGGNGDTAAEQRHTERAPRAPAALTSFDESQPAHERSSPPGTEAEAKGQAAVGYAAGGGARGGAPAPVSVAGSEDGVVTKSDSSSGESGQRWTVVTSPQRKAHPMPGQDTGSAADADADVKAVPQQPAVSDAPVVAPHRPGSPAAPASPPAAELAAAQADGSDERRGGSSDGGSHDTATPAVAAAGDADSDDDSDWGANVEPVDGDDNGNGSSDEEWA